MRTHDDLQTMSQAILMKDPTKEEMRRYAHTIKVYLSPKLDRVSNSDLAVQLIRGPDWLRFVCDQRQIDVSVRIR
jgi:hypothetical protein